MTTSVESSKKQESYRKTCSPRELDYKESWMLKNWCFWTVVLEKTLESPLECKKIQLVHPKGNQSWIFIGRTYVEAETPILWSPDVKNWLIGKDPDAGKDGSRKSDRMPLLTRWTWVWVISVSWWWTGKPCGRQSMGLQNQTWLSDWTELNVDHSFSSKEQV